MHLLINILIILIALLHLCFLILEMFLWTSPQGLRVFNQTLEQAKRSTKLAANQGLYNGFLSAGLIWSLTISDSEQARATTTFFLVCVVIAGLYGAWSVHRKILFIQALPALITLVLVLLASN